MNSFWKYLPVQWAHDWSTVGLHIWSQFVQPASYQWKEFTWKGLHFSNRLGIAGGVDKTGEQILLWQNFGAGFIEIGTITPKPQDPNPGKILARDWDNQCLWNKMGFPSDGCREAAIEMKNAATEKKVPVFLNVGKNRSTANENAVEDYLEVIQRCQEFADAITVNVSSPNTQNLRQLQDEKALYKLISKITKATDKPVLVKLSPDMTRKDLENSLQAAIEAGASGFVLTNTTLSRPPTSPFPKEGGLSGAGLKSLSEKNLVDAIQILGPKRKDLLIISVGGVMTPEDVQKRLSLGADLVQVYSALVFEGPRFFGKVNDYFKGVV